VFLVETTRLACLSPGPFVTWAPYLAQADNYLNKAHCPLYVMHYSGEAARTAYLATGQRRKIALSRPRMRSAVADFLLALR